MKPGSGILDQLPADQTEQLIVWLRELPLHEVAEKLARRPADLQLRVMDASPARN